MEVRCLCPSCGSANRLGIGADGIDRDGTLCRRCRRRLPVSQPEVITSSSGPITRCAVCGDDKLYLQKDFDQRVGCAIVAAGAALVPWTWGLSLGVCALVDYLLYRRLPPMTVCYVCGARYRGMAPHPDHAPYDLVTAQTWEARSLNWRRLNDATLKEPLV